MKNSHIEWTDHTFNPWEGCTKVSPGCAHCYAEARNARFGGGTAGNWGKGAPRRRTSVQNWNEPRKWDRAAALAKEAHWPPSVPYERPRVFCASLADVGDMEVPIEWFADLLQLIFECQNLDWQLLTKRPETFLQRLFHAAMYMAGYRDGQTSENPTAKAMSGWEWIHDWAVKGKPPENVWMGTTIEDRTRLEQRAENLARIPAKVLFWSVEPQIGDLGDVSDYLTRCSTSGTRWVDWVICGGESGQNARPMHPDWARSLRDQCKATGVPFLFKQWGEWAPAGDAYDTVHCRLVNKRTGKDLLVVFAWGKWDDAADWAVVRKFGKKAAGRLLDGIEHNGMPEVRP
jgi:protein gp37